MPYAYLSSLPIPKTSINECESFAREVWESASGLEQKWGERTPEGRQVFQKVHGARIQPTTNLNRTHSHHEAP